MKCGITLYGPLDITKWEGNGVDDLVPSVLKLTFTRQVIKDYQTDRGDCRFSQVIYIAECKSGVFVFVDYSEPIATTTPPLSQNTPFSPKDEYIPDRTRQASEYIFSWKVL